MLPVLVQKFLSVRGPQRIQNNTDKVFLNSPWEPCLDSMTYDYIFFSVTP